tara:strand:+ start:871 stop:1287 length:417 start_codon:yes stop_codon:yes gene_type:complete
MDDFPCTKCGLCCKNIANLYLNKPNLPLVLRDLIDVFPYKTKPDGSCSKLTDDGQCSVYDSRPIICNIKLSASLLNTDLQQFYRINADYCNSLIQKAGLSTDYLVKLEESSKETLKTYEEGRTGPRKRRSRKNSAKRT